MRFIDDKSFLNKRDLKAIELGIAREEISIIRIDRYYTDEQKKQNEVNAIILENLDKVNGSNIYSTYCDGISYHLNKEIQYILDTLQEIICLGQYGKNRYTECDYDFWVWTNNDGYYTLEINDSRTPKQRDMLISILFERLKQYEYVYDDLVVYAQYKAIYDPISLKNYVDDYMNKHLGQFMETNRGIVKFFKLLAPPKDNINYRYGYKRKYSKGNGFYIDDKDLFEIALNY